MSKLYHIQVPIVFNLYAHDKEEGLHAAEQEAKALLEAIRKHGLAGRLIIAERGKPVVVVTSEKQE